jgi:carbonic anhydrase/acetyltransferase-like protein (isoleucine patch superfamily)
MPDQSRLLTGDISPFIHAKALVLGSVTLKAGSSLWPGAVIRADLGPIIIGPFSNIQDNAVIHSDIKHPVSIGACVTVGHGAVVHGCTVEDCTILGMNAVAMNGASIGRGSVVAAGSIIKAGTIVPPFSLVSGNPAIVRENHYQDLISPLESALIYFPLSRLYKSGTRVIPERTAAIVMSAKRDAPILGEKLASGIDLIEAISSLLS